MKVICTNWAMTGAPPCSIGYMLLYQCVFFSKRYRYVTKSIHPFEMYDIPFPGSFSEFCKDTEIQKVGTINRIVMKKNLWFLAHKKSSFSHRNHFIKSSNPIQKTMECAEKTSRIEWWSWMIQSNLSYDCYDPIQSKLWLLWFLYRLVI